MKIKLLINYAHTATPIEIFFQINLDTISFDTRQSLYYILSLQITKTTQSQIICTFNY